MALSGYRGRVQEKGIRRIRVPGPSAGFAGSECRIYRERMQSLKGQYRERVQEKGGKSQGTQPLVQG